MNNPFLGKDLEGDYTGIRSLRVGEWRALYEIHLEDQVILVIRIGHRSKVYR